jgi:hypothetical protein
VKLTLGLVNRLRSIYTEIIDHFGHSKFYDWVPRLVIYYNWEKTTLIDGQLLPEWGEFDPNTEIISINTAYHEDINDIINTMLHEYRHYLQSPAWETRYNNMEVYNYETHPYELDAWKFAEEHIDKFIKTR